MGIEYRSFGVTALMAADEGKTTGLAAPFNSPTMIGEKPWGFREQIAPGAFAKTLKEGDVVYLLNHDTAKPLARTSAGTLTLRETDRGLEMEAVTPDTSYADDLRKNIKAGNVRGMSFGFEVVKDDWTDDEGNPSDKYTGTQRTLREVRLIEVSAVTFPAYETTNISARDAVKSARDMESRKAAKRDREDSDLNPDAEDRGPKPYGNVTYADPKNGKYPIDTKAHCKAAWSYINMPKNASKYPLNGVSLASVKAKIRAACQKFGITISDQNEAILALEWRKYTDLGALRDKPKGMKAGTAKRIPQITALLNEALCLFSNDDIDKMSDDCQRAIALVSSAATHANHIQDHEGLKPSDAVSDNDADGRSKPKPEDSTSAAIESDDALRADFAEAVSRGIALDA